MESVEVAREKDRLRSARRRREYPERVRAAERKCYWAHREERLAYARAHRQEHLEEHLVRERNEHKDHKEERNAYARRYHQEHREEILARKRAYYQRHREEGRAYRRVYRRTEPGREVERRAKNRQRALRAALAATLTRAEWQASLDFFGNCCAYCGASGVPLTQDHVVPLSAEGGYVVANIVPACRRCNSSKQDTSLDSWAKDPDAILQVRMYLEEVRVCG